MFEAFLLLLMAVIACAAWQFIPAFRSLLKATLIIAGIMIGLGALSYAAYNGYVVIVDKAIGGAVAGACLALVYAFARIVRGRIPVWRNGVRVRRDTF